jgi:hypothetical protein
MMNALQSVLKEELQRLERLCHKYREEIAKFPKGSISDKDRSGRPYAYLVYRNSGRIVFKYLGRARAEKVMKIRENIKSRKRLESLLKKAQGNLKELKRALHV